MLELPWHDALWRQLMARRSAGRLPHALLLSGPPGLGKARFSERLAQSLLCEAPQADAACGHCAACQLFVAGTHPDYLTVQPDGDGRVIKVDQIRTLCARLSQTSARGGFRVARLAPADAMNVNAANSLLKTLEEPGAKTLLLLETSQAGLLSATLRSRCQRLSFTAPSTEGAQAWLRSQGVADPVLALAQAGGAPLKALVYAQEDAASSRYERLQAFVEMVQGRRDPVALADAWSAAPAEHIEVLSTWIVDMIRLQAAAAPPALSNPDLRQDLQKLAARCEPRSLFEHLDRVRRALGAQDRGLNPQLLLESLLLPWCAAGAAA